MFGAAFCRNEKRGVDKNRQQNNPYVSVRFSVRVLLPTAVGIAMSVRHGVSTLSLG
jgi:hypothetical protein